MISENVDEMNADPEGRRPIATAIGRTIAVVSIFVALGPPVGAVSFFVVLPVAAGHIGQAGSAADVAWILLFGLIYGVPLSYLVGALPAAAAGTVLGVGRAVLGWKGWLPAWITALACATAVSDGDKSNRLVMAMVCLVATSACWAIARSVVPPGHSGLRMLEAVTKKWAPPS